jgi:hypothetical protein
MACYGGTVASPTDGFRDAAGVLIDPTTVRLKYKAPGAAVVIFTFGTGEIIKDGVGLYHYDADTTALVGVWSYEWLSPNQAIKPSSFQVLAAPL